jgi:hypothetical protein
MAFLLACGWRLGTGGRVQGGATRRRRRGAAQLEEAREDKL